MSLSVHMQVQPHQLLGQMPGILAPLLELEVVLVSCRLAVCHVLGLKLQVLVLQALVQELVLELEVALI